MSTRRIARKGKLVKGPGGRNFCRYCKVVECQAPRRTFCSDQCVHEYKLRRDPSYCRLHVFKRDKGVCAACGMDTIREHAIRRAALYSNHTPENYAHTKLASWQADHILPVIEGGGECGLENFRTLCTACHRAETKKLAARRALERRAFGDNAPTL